MKHVFIALAIGATLPTAALAHGPAAHGTSHANHHSKAVTKEQKDWGIAGDTSAVKRTVRIEMTDDMKFTPNRITVKLNETIRFQVMNKGKVLHEMVIGTKKELDEHAEMMKKFPNMEHDEPYMAHVDPGKSADMVWLFNRAGEFDFACLIPGHYQAGMVGKIIVNK
jgi:uncharacterized cupredoxin-like copper-binding protein